MFEVALAELTGMSEARVGAILHERSGSGLTALLTRAGFPESTFAAFRAALVGHAPRSASSALSTARRGCAGGWSSAC